MKPKTKFLIIVLLFLAPQAFSQDCTLNRVSDTIEINTIGIHKGIVSDSVLHEYQKKDICTIYASVSHWTKTIYVIYKDSIGCKVNIFTNSSSKRNIFVNDDFFDGWSEISSKSGTYVLYSENVGRYFFDWCFIKYHNKEVVISPVGCSIYNNLACIGTINKEYHDLIKKLFSVIYDGKVDSKQKQYLQNIK